MTSTDQISPPSPASGAGVGVLGEVREARCEADAAEVRVLVGAVEWAVQNPPLF